MSHFSALNGDSQPSDGRATDISTTHRLGSSPPDASRIPVDAEGEALPCRGGRGLVPRLVIRLLGAEAAMLVGPRAACVDDD
ncbi:hypothetical protein OJF2_64520 [Aquisphaera giovannonii]|uniref:Uncharacterized protein n=1 Tax=Aquisphaera giovannonii TaxID=406548 RepID=A0A5B9WDA7_9BACT|nr:hypothetical protein OJF2_64520 [Aquisphaera giovannonii]